MVTETLAELEKAAQEIRDGLKNVNEDIKKLTGRDPSDTSTRPVNRRVQLKRNAFNSNSRQAEPQNKQRRESNSTGNRRWGRTLDSGLRTSIDEHKLESSSDEDDSSKPAIQSVIASELKPARAQPKDTEEDTKTRSRNRRMFGFLIGTLQKFKEDTQQKTVGEQKREEIEKKLEQKAEEEKKEVSSQKRELFQTRREKQQELKALEQKMENAILKEQISEHNANLDHFIRLKSEPHIFYLPAKHNEETTKLLNESKQALKDLQEARFKAIDDLDEIGFATMVHKGVVKGKASQSVGSEVRDVGQRDLFDEEREQDELEKEGDVMMDGDRKDNVEWKKMEEEVGKANENVTDGSRKDVIVRSEVSSSAIVDSAGSEKTVYSDVRGEEGNEGESDMKEASNGDMKSDERKCVEGETEQEMDVNFSEKSEIQTQNFSPSKSLQEDMEEDDTEQAGNDSMDMSHAYLTSTDVRTDKAALHLPDNDEEVNA